MAVKPEEIASIIREQIEQFGTTITAVDVGSVVEAGDGIARVYGLGNAMYSELLEFQTVDDAGGRGTVIGMALNLEEDTVGAALSSRPNGGGVGLASGGRAGPDCTGGCHLAGSRRRSGAGISTKAPCWPLRGRRTLRLT